MIITLDAGVKSTLKWELPEVGERVVWFLDLGLERLEKPLEDQQQCATLKLACDHFLDTVISKYQTEKVILFRGTLDGYRMRDRLNDYLDILTANFPRSLEMEVQFVPEEGWHPLYTHQLFHKEAFPRFKVQFPRKKSLAKRGVLLPPSHVTDIDSLIERAEGDYRILYESELLYECTGIEELLCHVPSLSVEGKRVLDGFQAAEGKVVNTASSPLCQGMIH